MSLSNITLLLYLVLCELHLTREDIKRTGQIHATIYLIQRYCIDLGYHFNWSNGDCAPRDFVWEDRFENLHLPVQLILVELHWKKLARSNKALHPRAAKKLKQFCCKFKQALSCEIWEYAKIGTRLQALAALHYLEVTLRYKKTPAQKQLVQHPTYPGRVKIAYLQTIIDQWEGDPQLCKIKT